MDAAACRRLWQRVLLDALLAAQGRDGVVGTGNPATQRRARAYLTSRDFRLVAELAGFDVGGRQTEILARIDALPRQRSRTAHRDAGGRLSCKMGRAA